MIWNDEKVIDLFFDENNNFNKEHLNINNGFKWTNKCKFASYSGLKDYLLNRYVDKKNMSILEILYRIVYKIEEAPRCIICGNFINFSKSFERGYYKHFCSHACRNSKEGIKIWEKLIADANLEKYGVYNAFSREDIKEKIKQINKERYGNEIFVLSEYAKNKRIETFRKHFNNDYYFWSDKHKQDIYDYIVSKNKKVCLLKYGVDHPFKCEEVKLRYKKTLVEKYGYDCILKIPLIRNKIKEIFLKKYGVDHPFKNKEIFEKCIQTKKINGTFSTSKLEEKCYDYVCSLFGKDDVERQYKDWRYEFHCDFYLKNEDIFIEVNGMWTHGNHPYNDNCIEDVMLAEKWKSKDSTYYSKAYEYWTQYDVLKRETAEKNSLKYFEYFGNDIEEFKLQLNDFLRKIGYKD